MFTTAAETLRGTYMLTRKSYPFEMQKQASLCIVNEKSFYRSKKALLESEQSYIRRGGFCV